SDHRTREIRGIKCRPELLDLLLEVGSSRTGGDEVTPCGRCRVVQVEAALGDAITCCIIATVDDGDVMIVSAYTHRIGGPGRYRSTRDRRGRRDGHRFHASAVTC